MINQERQGRRSGARFASVFSIALAVLAAAASSSGSAAVPRVLPPDELPRDVRLGPLKDLNGYFPFVVPDTVEAWHARADSLRQQVLVSQGLWPMPTRCPLNPMIHGRIEQDDYTIDKVYFESMPGFFVTGNLYRPKGEPGKRPGVLSPHGHWANGRFHDCGRDSVRKQIVQGAERFEDGGRGPLQARCVQLARMGCVVFHYDMIGYADSQQISSAIIHGFKQQRPEMNNAGNWGLFSPQAESRLQSAMGLQTFNSIRSLDFLMSLPDVDTARIAVTGASGGGTQTFMLSAIDPRVQVALPAVMVSTAMQGGCTCENACCLRVGTGNIELAAMFAPKPLALTAADDWTVEMETKGFPELRQLYKLLSAPDNVSLAALTHFPHNYNNVSRAVMYHWFNKHLHLGLEEPIVEERYTRMAPEELSVWDAAHPRPAGGADFERQLLAWWDQDSRAQLDALLPTDTVSCQRYQQFIGKAIDAILPRQIPTSDQVELKIVSEQKREGYQEIAGLLTRHLPPRLAIGANQKGTAAGIQEQLPLLLLQPTDSAQRVCLLAFPEGKAGLFDENGDLRPPLRRLIDSGVGVCAADLLYQGEFLEDQQPNEKTRRVENPREAAAYTFGYNPSRLAHRASDLLTILALFDQDPYQADQVDLVGLGSAGPVAALARAKARHRVTRLAVDDADFRFADVNDLWSPMFLPGGAKYHDVPGLLAMGAPHPLWLASSAQELPTPIAAAYQACGQLSRVRQWNAREGDKLKDIVQWLIEEGGENRK